MKKFANVRNDFSHHSGPKKIKPAHLKKIMGSDNDRRKSELFAFMTKVDMETTNKIVGVDVLEAMRLHDISRKQLTWWGTCLDVLLKTKAKAATTP